MKLKYKKGFELFKTRSMNDKVSFEELENKLDFKIPPLYKLYHETFIIDVERKGFWYEKNGKQLPFLSQNYFELGLEDIGVNSFLPIESILKYDEALFHYLKYNVPNDEINYYFEKRLLPLCSCEVYGRKGGGIGVGTMEGEVDKVILIPDGNINESKIISDNVFSFIKGMYSFVAWENVNINLLYKNWGEDFWRIRDDKESI